MDKLTHTNLVKEICKREQSLSREVNATDVGRVLRHLFDIFAEVDETYEKEEPYEHGMIYYLKYNPAISFVLHRIKHYRTKRTGKGRKG